MSENTYYTSKPKFNGSGTSKWKDQFGKRMATFLVIAASIAFYFTLLRATHVNSIFDKIFDILKPVLYGCIIAYLLNPIVKKIDKYLVPVLEERFSRRDKAEKASRGIGIFLSLILMILLIIALFNLLIPELYNSIRNMIMTLPGQLNDLMVKLNSIKLDDSTTGIVLKTLVEEGSKMLQNWLRTDLLARVNELMSNLTVGVISVVNEIFNLLIGIIISIYIMFSRETFVRQSKKAVYALFQPKQANLILHLANKSNEIFGGFIIGKIIDSIIIGILCFICLTILKMPYTMLVSVIVGVTNVIPFFGPYIGAIPSAILILLSDPMKGVYFIIFILLLQQFDGNILGPKILGNSTGLSAFWVIFAILLGGGLFGFAGMILGVPTFAVLYYIAQMLLNSRLEHKKLPKESEYYDVMSYVDNAGKYVRVSGEKTEKEEKNKKKEE